MLTTDERRDFQTETVDVRNCSVAERKATSCSAGSSASFSVGAQAEVGGGAGAVVAQLDVGVGASASFQLGFDRSSGESLDLDTPPQGFVNRYWVEKEFRILSGRGRIQHKDGDMEDGVYTLQTGCFLRIERVENLTCEAASTPTPSPTPVAPTRTPTPIAVEPTATPTTGATTGTEQPAAGTTREIDGIIFVYVPAGEFTMGSNDGYDDEKPVHTVYVDGYWIGRTEVTNAQYARCVEAGGCPAANNNRWNDGTLADYPVTDVSWDNAVVYTRWLAEESGVSVRLPTEAEWEKAARGSDGRGYPWGNEAPNERLLNFNQNVRRTTAVGSYPEGASPYGALDMAGNVWEWAQDWYTADYYAGSPTRNPAGPTSGKSRVLRGGSWLNDATLVRSANRNGFGPDNRLNNVGFRLVAPGL